MDVTVQRKNQRIEELQMKSGCHKHTQTQNGTNIMVQNTNRTIENQLSISRSCNTLGERQSDEMLEAITPASNLSRVAPISGKSEVVATLTS